MLVLKRVGWNRSGQDPTARPGAARRAPLVGLALLAGALLSLVPAGHARAGAAVVRPDPLGNKVLAGDTVVVNLYVQDVTSLYGADIRLLFDPTLLEVQDAAPAQPGVQIKPLNGFLRPDFVIKKKACNAVDPADPDCAEAGIVWYAATQVSPSPPAGGSGAVAAVTFKALRAGVSPLTVVYHKLSGSSGSEIASVAQNGTLTIIAGSRLYLPSITR